MVVSVSVECTRLEQLAGMGFGDRPSNIQALTSQVWGFKALPCLFLLLQLMGVVKLRIAKFPPCFWAHATFLLVAFWVQALQMANGDVNQAHAYRAGKRAPPELADHITEPMTIPTPKSTLSGADLVRTSLRAGGDIHEFSLLALGQAEPFGACNTYSRACPSVAQHAPTPCRT